MLGGRMTRLPRTNCRTGQMRLKANNRIIGTVIGLCISEACQRPSIKQIRLRVPPVVGAGRPVTAKNSESGILPWINQNNCQQQYTANKEIAVQRKKIWANGGVVDATTSQLLLNAFAGIDNEWQPT
jgi:hypothetical protein